MKDKLYKEKLKNCAKNAVVPDVLDEIKRADFSAYRDNIVPENAVALSKEKKVFVWTTFVATITASILLFVFAILPLFSTSIFDNTVYATASVKISQTANYSIELNKELKVIDIMVDNQDGNSVLENLAYRQKNFDDVLTTLLKACTDYWGLTEEELSSDKIAFSVDCHDADLKTDLQHHWNNSLNAAKEHCCNHKEHH